MLFPMALNQQQLLEMLVNQVAISAAEPAANPAHERW